jgi:hypothetical protein
VQSVRGTRLQPVARAVDIGGTTIVDVVKRPVVKTPGMGRMLAGRSDRTPLTPRQR